MDWCSQKAYICITLHEAVVKCSAEVTDEFKVGRDWV